MARLSEFTAQLKREIYDQLRAGSPPAQGKFDAELLAAAREKGLPQMGSTRHTPHAIFIEFIFPDPTSAPIVFSVEIEAPERIVFLPVPDWVIDDVWQGEVAGRFVFESEALLYMQKLTDSLRIENNEALFEQKAPKRKE